MTYSHVHKSTSVPSTFSLKLFYCSFVVLLFIDEVFIVFFFLNEGYRTVGPIKINLDRCLAKQFFFLKKKSSKNEDFATFL